MAIADWEDRERAVAEIHTCLANTVTTIILIGSKTAQRPWGRQTERTRLFLYLTHIIHQSKVSQR